MQLLIFQILIVLLTDFNTIWVLSCKNITDLTVSLWLSSVLRQMLLSASQILIISSSDSDTIWVLSYKNVTDQTVLLWSLSIYIQAFQSAFITSFIVIQSSSLFWKSSCIKLWMRLNRKTDKYTCREVFSMMFLLDKINWCASWIRWKS